MTISMKDEFLNAPRRGMTIRIVEPAAVKLRIVDERRPLSLARVAASDASINNDAHAVAAIAVCVVFLVGFAALVTWGLGSALSALPWLTS